jgi:hypothetical protein
VACADERLLNLAGEVERPRTVAGADGGFE